MNTAFYGNETPKRILSHTLSSGNLGHAYLIYGEKGLGKQTFARLFAKSVLCQGEQKPCGLCTSCKKMENGTHPDVQVYLGGEAKGSVHIDLVRAIRADCAVKPNESTVKIYILTNVQNMTIGAFNAFLKTLEEPPKHTLFLLTAPNIDQLPETVVSRLMPIQLFPLSDSQMQEALAERFPDEPADLLASVAAISQGNLGNAIRQLSDADFQSLQEDLKLLCQCIVAKREYPLLKALTAYEKDKAKLMLLLVRLLAVLRSALFLKLHASTDSDELARSLSSGLSRMQIIHLIDFLEEVKGKLSTNANYNLLLVYLCAGIKQRID